MPSSTLELDWFAALDREEPQPRSTLTPPGGPIYFRLRRLSHCRETVQLANQMNLHPKLPEQMKYDFLQHAGALVERRTTGWTRRPPENEADLMLVMNYFNLSRAKARQALKCLRRDQVEALRERTSAGGC